jgi:hypothetical protein
VVGDELWGVKVVEIEDLSDKKYCNYAASALLDPAQGLGVDFMFGPFSSGACVCVQEESAVLFTHRDMSYVHVACCPYFSDLLISDHSVGMFMARSDAWSGGPDGRGWHGAAGGGLQPEHGVGGRGAENAQLGEQCPDELATGHVYVYVTGALAAHGCINGHSAPPCSALISLMRLIGDIAGAVV